MRRPVVLIGAAVAVTGLVLLSWLGGGDDDEPSPSPAASAEPVADNPTAVITPTSSTTTTVPGFRLVTVRPGDGAQIPTGVQALVLLFSDAVDPGTATRFEVSPAWQGRARILDRSVLFEPAVPWAE